MNAITLEATVGVDHKLHIDLPLSLPEGSCVRVTLEPMQETAPETLSSDADSRTPLWRRLSELRAQAATEHQLPKPLSWDEILEETARRRGEVDE